VKERLIVIINKTEERRRVIYFDMSLGPIECDRFNCKRRNQISFNSYISTHVTFQTKHKLYIHTHEVTAVILIYLINWLIPEIAQIYICVIYIR